MVGNQVRRKKPRVLCFHGFRTSGEILKKMMGKWPDPVLENFDFDFFDAPFPAKGKSDVESLYYPPYCEWYQVNEGGMLASVLPPIEGVAFTQVPKIKFVIIISGFVLRELKSGPPKLLANVYSVPIECPSLHLIGDEDFLKERGFKLLKSFVNPFVIHHSMGHTLPKLDEKGLETMLEFIEKIQEMFPQELQIGLRPKTAL